MTSETERTFRRELSPVKRLLLEKRLQGGGKHLAPGQGTIPRRDGDGPVVLSFAQRRLWFAQRLAADSPLYHIASVLRLQGSVDRERLDQSLKAVMARHESLRTRFLCRDGEPLQVVDASATVVLRTTDLSGQSTAAHEVEVQRLLKEEVSRPFDLSSGILLRALLVKLDTTDHRLLITVHHIVSDGWSMNVLAREVMAFYEAAVSGKRPWSELPIQYPDFAAWQHQWMQGDALQGQLEWWKEHLAGAPDFLELPTDRPRPAVQSFQGHCRWKTFPGPLSDALRALSHQEGATLFMTLLAAFQILLHRLTGQADILIGTPVAGRDRSETEGLIGLFVNMLVLRSKRSGNPAFREFLRNTREETLEAYARQDFPFEKLVEELRPERKSSHSPLFQVAFVLQPPPEPLPAAGDLTVTLIPERDMDTGTAKFDLTFNVQDDGHGLSAFVEYNSDVFEEATIDRMLSCFQVLLEGVVADAGQTVGKLPLLTPAERHRMLVEWNETGTRYPRDHTIPQLFNAQVSRNPQAVAVTLAGRQVTYRQLDQRANQIANLLRTLGVGPDRLVAVCLERSIEMIIALLGILKAGGAYVSLEPACPQERLRSILDDARPTVVLTREKARDIFNEPAGAKVICLDRDGAAVARESTVPPPSEARPPGPMDLAYVSYTSGSTGRPKGVCVPHRAVIRLLFNTDYVHLNSADTVAHISNCAFDASTFEIWGALLHGARLAILPQEIALSARALGQEIRGQRITTMFVTTALFNQLSREAPEIFHPVRHLLFGGETATPDCVRDVLKHGPPSRLLHMYGPTEATTFATWHQVHVVAETATGIPIGRPIANTETYVLDELLQPVPIGVTGELYVGGHGLARGYLNREELTKEKFIPHPFRQESGARLYRTGDRVRYLADGNLEFVGRADDQIKLRGFRVELGEIEAALNQHAGVRECLVVAQDASLDERLTAYVVAKTPSPPEVEELRSFARTKLPDYMVPAFFVFLPALPLNTNGKVDRQALPAPDQARPGQKEFLVPRDETELQLAGIWEELLGTRPIGALDNFFDLGGHSLLAMRLLARVEKSFGKPLPVSAIFQSPTLGEFAGFIRNGATKPLPAASSIVRIQPDGSKPPLFLVHGAGGGMFWGYTNLSRHLGPDQPVYGFKARELKGPEEFSAIEELAAQYVSDLRRFQPRGPYYLGGYCFGGNVAWEMARQLRAQSERVALVVLMNSAPTHSSRARIAPTPAWTIRFVGNLCYLARCFFQRPLAQQRRFIAWRAGAMVRKVAQKFGWAAGALRTNAYEMLDLSTFPSEQRPLWEAHIRALLLHRTAPYAGRVMLLRSRAHPFWCSFDPAYDWGEFVSSDLEVRIVPGAHEQILEEPHVQKLAQELGQALHQAQEDDRAHRSLVTSPGSGGKEAAISAPSERKDAESHQENRGKTEPTGLAADYPRDKCVHQLFEEQAARTPDAVAVVWNNERLTYREIDNRANQLARTLRQMGVGPDVPAGISLPRSPAMVVGVLAILKAGGAYVPLDPAYPRERLRLMIETARVPVLVTQTSLSGQFQLPVAGCQLLCVDALDLARGGVESDSRWEGGAAQPQHLAYVIHTSGSTGTPKGVAMPHRPLVNLIAWQLRNSSAGREARTLQFASLSFDVSFQEMFSTWCAGGTLVLVDEETRRDPAALLNFIMDQGIERLFLPFVALQQLAEASCEWTLIPSCLREVITAGEQLQITPGLVRMFERMPGGTLHNHYGPSETHVVTAFTLTGPPSQWPALPPIGKPIANTQIHLLDAERRPVAAGAEGEIYIGGDCLARGYLHRPELTAERFVPDPFQPDGSRLYKTGDLGRRRSDGEIEFLGRIDQQVKIRGFRIELGEIEAALRQHPDVRETVVLLRDDPPGDKRLVAYFVPKADEASNPEELRSFLKQKLPEYMVPSVFVLLEALPLTPSGKVDRKQLPAPPQDRTAAREDFVAPRDTAEEQLAQIWEELLNVRPIGIRDQFFESGGHSLLAARVVARIEKTFGRKLSVAALYQSPTVAQLAKVLRDGEGRSPSPASSIVAIQGKGARRPLFLVHGAGGGMFWGYANLSRHLGTDQPIYAFNSRGLDGVEEFGTIEEMAEHYAADLRAFQPNGPYLLGGYCFGGNVAYEIARRLEAQGEKVALLAVFNAWPPNSSYTRPRVTPMFCLKFLRNLRYWAGYVRRLKPQQQRELLLWKIRSIGRKSRRFANRLRISAPTIDVAEWVDLSAQPEDRHELWAAHIQAYLEHRPQPFHGHLTLFRTRCHPVFCSFDEACGWRELADEGVTVRLVPGAHESILDEPQVAVLARELERELAAAGIDAPGKPQAASPRDAPGVRSTGSLDSHEAKRHLVPEASQLHHHP